MSSTAVMPGPGLPPPPAANQRSKRWLRSGVPALAFVVGVAIGSAMPGEPDADAVASSPTYLSLRGELTESQKEAEDLEAQVAAAEATITQAAEAAEAAEARLAEQTAVLDERSALLDQREQALTAREAEPRATRAPAPSTAGSSPPATVPGPPAAADLVPPGPRLQLPTRTSFRNCDAARAAGAAPVRVGEPGYGRHLDVDGDGIGCE